MKLTTYICEVGVLLPETHKEYSWYTTVYGKKNSYYDESVIAELSLDKAKEFGKDYVDKGVKNTYCVISKNEIEGDDTTVLEIKKDIKERHWSDCIDNFNGDYLSEENILYSCYKNKDGVIKEDFAGNSVNDLQGEK